MPVLQALELGTCEFDPTQAVGRQSAHAPLDGTEMVPGLQEGGDVETDDPAHDHGDAHDDGCEGDSKAGVRG